MLTDDTHCYTFEVTMIVQVVAPTREEADQKLHNEGGYVSSREVEFIKSTLLHSNSQSE